MKWNYRTLYYAIVSLTLMMFAVVLGRLTINSLVPGNGLKYATDFTVPEHFIQGPFPTGRVELIRDTYRILYEPVYFNVYSPQHFRTAVVTLQYEKPANLDVRFGVKTVGNWSYDLQSLTDNHEQVLTFDLTNAEFNKNKLQFIISVPGLTLEDTLIIRKAMFELIK
ncbi:MAG: hypothetical protein V1763_02915 [Parcubacteria group bacterium]